ncbi:hypothetical protein BLOT_007328 [Blomia tropicalis]|nr:hypothetical protein BLOT_007328 [Blomia tropicalis]
MLYIDPECTCSLCPCVWSVMMTSSLYPFGSTCKQSETCMNQCTTTSNGSKLSKIDSAYGVNVNNNYNFYTCHHHLHQGNPLPSKAAYNVSTYWLYSFTPPTGTSNNSNTNLLNKFDVANNDRGQPSSIHLLLAVRLPIPPNGCWSTRLDSTRLDTIQLDSNLALSLNYGNLCVGSRFTYNYILGKLVWKPKWQLCHDPNVTVNCNQLTIGNSPVDGIRSVLAFAI